MTYAPPEYITAVLGENWAVSSARGAGRARILERYEVVVSQREFETIQRAFRRGYSPAACRYEVFG